MRPDVNAPVRVEYDALVEPIQELVEAHAALLRCRGARFRALQHEIEACAGVIDAAEASYQPLGEGVFVAVGLPVVAHLLRQARQLGVIHP